MIFKAAVAVLLSVAGLPRPHPLKRHRRSTKGINHLILGSVPGGGYDTYVRILSRHYGRLLGDSTITVQYMPGAESLTAANYLFRQAPTDGTTIGGIDRRYSRCRS